MLIGKKRRFFSSFFWILLCLVDLSSGDCPKNGMCTEELEKSRIRGIAKRIYEELPDMAYSTAETGKIDNTTRLMYQNWLDESHQEKSNIFGDPDVKIHFITSSDPFLGEDRSQLSAAFEVQDELKNTVLVDATLIIHTNIPSSNHDRVNHVSVQVFEKNSDNSLGPLITTNSFAIRRNEQIRINLPAPFIQRWFSRNSTGNLFVSATVDGTNVAIHPQQTTKDSELMVLQLATKFNGVIAPSRKRRSYSTPICTKDRRSPGCCLYDLTIEFDKIGWDWIIAPPKYNAYMCRGDCKLNSHHFMNDYAHSKIMRSQGRIDDDVNTEMGFCCHPTDYDYIKLIYVNRSGRVSVANVNGMIARRCGCS
ncbi:hypothetical protein CAEBREN_22190 [Caenorhabditis brenneri]|uniref:TGF-beta family profile domain-containing protein n=1 Tax=Caenorhabditis brenneri TaxID=135651 RepID=G0MYW5_CAEBE|nr:hypothetical protein CAEBREN_22190 [Caenorhabditis brenneri]